MPSSLPPLVAPAPSLTREEVARYSRHLIIPDLGIDGQKRLKNARVLVIGAGGLGSPTLLYLAAAGVGTLGIVDFDVVDESNLHRQIIHGTADVGRSKPSRRAIRSRPSIRLSTCDCTSSGWGRQCRRLVQAVRPDPGRRRQLRHQVPGQRRRGAGRQAIRVGSIYRFEGQVSVFWEDAPDGPDGEKRGLNYRDLYPEPPPPAWCRRAPKAGVGHHLRIDRVGDGHRGDQADHRAGESLLGRLMIYDALEMSYRTIKIRKDPATPKITELVDYEYFCGLGTDDATDDVSDTAANSTITPSELRALLDSGSRLALIDVREQAEFDIVHIDGAQLIPKSLITSGRACRSCRRTEKRCCTAKVACARPRHWPR